MLIVITFFLTLCDHIFLNPKRAINATVQASNAHQMIIRHWPFHMVLFSNK